ncbi:sulfotransferase family protein [Azospirillum halopraeferens]|uniref:sulfotransferase family protein n=1 Tax=Azospirillum halopraeferens TaxID=34010 RepID=UPI00040371C1|nr:sulfotransferase family protein [Azospirillum halopraeferens]
MTTAAKPPANRALVVLGMHRSGTSALAGTFHKLGLDFGSNLMPPEEGSNELGFWEHNSIVPIHERILRALGSHWSDPAPLPEGWTDRPEVRGLAREIVAVLRHDFDRPGDWGMKDPRMCRLLPLWMPLFAEVGARPVFVFIGRHPYEVAQSLSRRDGLPLDRSYELWYRHMAEADAVTRGFPRVFLRYADLLADWRGCVGGALDRLGFASLRAAMDGPAGAEVDAFLTPDLRHNAADEARFRAEAPAPVQAMHDRLSAPGFAAGRGSGGWLARLKSVLRRA